MSEVDISALQARVAQLEAGQSAGTTLASFEGGAFGYQMVDATYKARCRFLIPTRTVRINKALLHFSLQPFRSGAASGTAGGTTGGESVAHTHSMSYNTSGESITHSHTTPTHQHVTATTSGLNPSLWGGGADSTAGGGGYMGVMNGSPGLTTFRTDTSGSSTSGADNVGHVHAATGGTNNESAGHTHTVPGSALSIPDSLYETGMAQGCRVYIDGVDVTPTLGGPWGTGAALDVHDLDVSQWLSAKGWHEVQISSTTIGGIFPSLAIFAVVGV